MKKESHRFYLIIAIFMMLILIINGRVSVEEPSSENETYFSLESGQGIMTTIFNFPRYLRDMIFNPSESQLRFFLRDGFAFSGGRSDVEEVEEIVRIGQARDDSEEIYMLTWQPAESFVRRSNLIHDQDGGNEIPLARYINSDEPLVYIFNSHPAELIGAPGVGRYREGTTNILEFSHLMANIFASYSIPSLVEDRDVRDVLRANGWNFNASYQASRIFIEERIFQYPTLEFFFDVHRDAVPDEVARINIGGRYYARVVFVIGLDNPAGYNENLEMAMRLHELLEARRPGISRGIFPSYGNLRNGVYNQDIAPTLQLIEIGSYQSTLEEAINTTEILASVIAEYILTYVE